MAWVATARSCGRASRQSVGSPLLQGTGPESLVMSLSGVAITITPHKDGAVAHAPLRLCWGLSRALLHSRPRQPEDGWDLLGRPVLFTTAMFFEAATVVSMAWENAAHRR